MGIERFDVRWTCSSRLRVVLGSCAVSGLMSHLPHRASPRAHKVSKLVLLGARGGCCVVVVVPILRPYPAG